MQIYEVPRKKGNPHYVIAKNDVRATEIALAYWASVTGDPDRFSLTPVSIAQVINAMDTDPAFLMPSAHEGMLVADPLTGWTVVPVDTSNYRLPFKDVEQVQHRSGGVVAIMRYVTGDQLIIFGRDSERAADIGLRFVSIIGELPVDWRGDEWSCFKAKGDRSQLLDAIASGLEGLGLYDEGKGWTISPLPAELDDFTWDWDCSHGFT